MILRLCLLAFAARSAQATFDFTDAPFDRCATSHGLSLDDSLYIFVLSEDSTLWQKRQERGGWSSWQLIGACAQLKNIAEGGAVKETHRFEQRG